MLIREGAGSTQAESSRLKAKKRNYSPTRINRNQTGKINHENTKTRKKDCLNFVLSNFRVFVMGKSFAIKCKKFTTKILNSKHVLVIEY